MSNFDDLRKKREQAAAEEFQRKRDKEREKEEEAKAQQRIREQNHVKVIEGLHTIQKRGINLVSIFTEFSEATGVPHIRKVHVSLLNGAHMTTYSDNTEGFLEQVERLNTEIKRKDVTKEPSALRGRSYLEKGKVKYQDVSDDRLLVLGLYFLVPMRLCNERSIDRHKEGFECKFRPDGFSVNDTFVVSYEDLTKERIIEAIKEYYSDPEKWTVTWNA